MPISTVTPTPIAAPGQPLPNPADLASWPIRMAEMHRWMRETLSPGVELIGNQSLTNALAAQEAAVSAYVNANYKGAWSSLTGALNVPALVSHSGQRWNLLSNLANVTTSEPGVGAAWELFALPSATGVGFDPTGTTLTSTQVQAAIVALSAGVDKAIIDFENPILNGAMRVAQTGTSFSSSTGVNAIDGWKYFFSGACVATISQQSAATPDNENAKWLIATVTTQDSTISATDYALLSQNVEGLEIAKYKGVTFTLSFWAKSSVTGIHSVGLRSGSNDAFYVAEVNILAANTPQFVSITVAGGIPAIGTWDFSTGYGISLSFVLAAGSNYTGATGVWSAGSKFASASQVNAIGTIGNVFGITAVQINPGYVAKGFQVRSYAYDLHRCQRYYENVDTVFGPTSNSSYGRTGQWKVEKREIPSVSYVNYAGPGSSATCLFVPLGKSSFSQADIGNSGTVPVKTTVTGDARL